MLVALIFLTTGTGCATWNGQAFDSVAAPVVSGTGVVGQKLKAKVSSATSPEPTYVRYQWLRDGKQIEGSEGASYVLSRADRGKRIQVEVCYVKSGFVATCIESAKTKKIADEPKKKFKQVSKPSLTGKALFLETLTAKRDKKTKPIADRVSYRWLRSGAEIPQATSKKYTLEYNDLGERIQVEVCYGMLGYETKCVLSAKSSVVKMDYSSLQDDDYSHSADSETDWAPADISDSSRCDIKGNISYYGGERIYHVRGQEYYDATVIDTSAGERWFCSEAEARAAGWRKSKV